MGKSSVMVSIDSNLMDMAKKTMKGRVSGVCENAIRKELGIQQEQPDELVLLQELLERKGQVQRLAQMEDGGSAIRYVANKIKAIDGKNPETVQEKISFWERVRKEALTLLMKKRVEGEKVSPAPLPKGGKL